MAHGERTETLGLRLTPDEARVVSDLADETGLSKSDVVRQAIRLAYADRFKVKPKRSK